MNTTWILFQHWQIVIITGERFNIIFVICVRWSCWRHIAKLFHLDHFIIAFFSTIEHKDWLPCCDWLSCCAMCLLFAGFVWRLRLSLIFFMLSQLFWFCAALSLQRSENSAMSIKSGKTIKCYLLCYTQTVALLLLCS